MHTLPPAATNRPPTRAHTAACCHQPATHPHARSVQLSKAKEEHKPLLGHLLWVAQHVAKQEDLAQGYRVVINDGPNGSECLACWGAWLRVLALVANEACFAAARRPSCAPQAGASAL